MSDHSVNHAIGIIGGGFVGSAAKQYYKNALVYDTNPERANATFAEVCEQEYIFITVPTPPKANGEIDLSIVEKVISDIPAGKKIILKSTCVPGTTEKLQAKYPDKKLVYCPEFLTAKFAAEDFAYPDKNVVGYTAKYPELADEVAQILPRANTLKCHATEAEMIKYSTNSFYALKVIFGNELYDLCQKLGIDYNVVHEGFALDKRINDSHFDVMHGESRGFGGACLPKDTSAIVNRAKELGVDLSLIRTAIETNKKYREMPTRK